MGDTIQELRKGMIESMELEQGYRRLQMWLMTVTKFRVVFLA